VRSFFTKVFRRLAAAGFDLSRYRGILVVMAGVLLVFVAMHYVLGFTFGSDAAALHPRQRPLGWQMYEKTWGRVAAIDRLHLHGQLPPGTRLGVYIGVSTTATGIQRKYLDAGATSADRWIVLTGAGLSFENLESVMQPIFFCSLKPSVVALGVHPQMLVGERYLGDEPTMVPQAVVGRRLRSLRTSLAFLSPLSGIYMHWGIFHRIVVGHFLRSHIYSLRLWVFRLAGVSAERLFAPSPEPWDDDPLWLWHLDDREGEFSHLQIDFWSKRGHFKAENYDPDGDQARSFVRMLRDFRKLGAKVYVINMPMRSNIRRQVPPNAEKCFRDVIASAFPEDPPTVVDLHDAMPDQFFTDEAHLSKTGSNKLSKMVAERLQAPD